MLTFPTILSFLLGMGFMYLNMRFIFPNWRGVYSWMFNLRRNERLGDVCETDLVLDKKGFNVGYCFNKKTALWVSYVLSKTSTTINKERGDNYFPDPEVPEKYRVEPSDYTHSGYDKGHLAPSSAIDYSRKSNDETFMMSNVAPQHPQLNRNAWRALEQKIQTWVRTKGKLFVVTGPVFKQRNRRINGIAVPSYFYKVLYQPKEEQAIAFLFPNAAIPSDEIWEYAMTVSELEEKTGFAFFKKLSKRKRRCKLYVDLEWWKE